MTDAQGTDSSGSARRNVELKAKNPDSERSLATCRALGAVDRGVISQRDTYFEVSSGGLKLREESPGGPHLIQFERESGTAAAEQLSHRGGRGWSFVCGLRFAPRLANAAWS